MLLKTRVSNAVVKRVFVILLMCVPLSGFSQYWQAGGFIGTSNYSGDLAEQRVDLKYTRYSLGLFVKRDINRYITLRAGFNYGKIAGADSTNKHPDLLNRNLSFRSPIREAHIVAEFNFLDLDEKRFTPYVFGGVAVFSFYPTTKDALGRTVNLRPLTTEGQGMAQYPSRKQYNLQQIAIPFGAGVKVLLTDQWILGLEFGLRKTFTDYLDDVSRSYIDRNTLLLARGQTAVDMAYRGTGAYPADGTIRGSDKYDDWYIFSGLSLSYRFGAGGNNHWKRQKVMNCPRL
jgi:hypothetical protein